MAKILVLVACFALVYWILRSHKKKSYERAAEHPKGGEDMVRCAHCGVHLPRSESIKSGRSFYCTVEHRPQHQETE